MGWYLELVVQGNHNNGTATLRAGEIGVLNHCHHGTHPFCITDKSALVVGKWQLNKGYTAKVLCLSVSVCILPVLRRTKSVVKSP